MTSWRRLGSAVIRRKTPKHSRARHGCDMKPKHKSYQCVAKGQRIANPLLMLRPAEMTSARSAKQCGRWFHEIKIRRRPYAALGSERPSFTSCCASEKIKTITIGGRRYFNLSRGGSYEAAKRGEIPTIRIGRLIRVPVRALDRMLDKAAERDNVEAI